MKTSIAQVRLAWSKVAAAGALSSAVIAACSSGGDDGSALGGAGSSNEAGTSARSSGGSAGMGGATASAGETGVSGGGATSSAEGGASAGTAGESGTSAGASGSSGEGGANGGAAGSSGAGGAPSVPCKKDSECDADKYCKKTANACDAGSDGECAPIAAGFSPVCGCNGVTYGSARLAVKAGVAVRGSGACDIDAGSTKFCANKDKTWHCDAGQTCVALAASNACVVPERGQCWVAGTDCTGSTGNFRFCGEPTSTPCITLCQVAQSAKEGQTVYPNAVLACLTKLP